MAGDEIHMRRSAFRFGLGWLTLLALAAVGVISPHAVGDDPCDCFGENPPPSGCVGCPCVCLDVPCIEGFRLFEIVPNTYICVPDCGFSDCAGFLALAKQHYEACFQYPPGENCPPCDACLNEIWAPYGGVQAVYCAVMWDCVLQQVPTEDCEVPSGTPTQEQLREALCTALQDLIATAELEYDDCCGDLDDEQRVQVVCEWLADCGDEWCNAFCAGSGGCEEAACDAFCVALLDCVQRLLDGCLTPAHIAALATCYPKISNCKPCEDLGGGLKGWMPGGEIHCDCDGDGVEGTCSDILGFLMLSAECYDSEDPMPREDAILLACQYMASCETDGCCGLIACTSFFMQFFFGEPLSQFELDVLNACCGSGCSLEDLQKAKPPKGVRVDRKKRHCPCRTTCPNPKTSAPVDLALGHKSETVVDLSVPITGGDWTLERRYLSDPSWDEPDVTTGRTYAPAGAKWAASPFEYSAVREGEDDEFYLHLAEGTAEPPIPGIKITGSGAELATVGSSLALEGQTHQIVSKTQVCIDGVVHPVYRITEPGAWEVDYFRAADEAEEVMEALGGCAEEVTDPPAALLGFMAQERDAHGNPTTYDYLVFGSTARLSRLYLNGSPESESKPEAEVWFTWILDSSSPVKGRLRKVEVVRWVGATTPSASVVAMAEYTYFDDIIGISPDVGASGDLVQVVRSVRMDPPPGAGTNALPVWHRTVAQYRYHGGDGASSGVNDDNHELTWQGEPHQLKMIIEPQQIEFVAANEAISGTADTKLMSCASLLLTKSDGDEIVTGVLAVDMAAKIIEEYEASGTHRVLTQYAQSSCGCGGGGTGAPQGLKLTYEYATPGTGAPDGVKWVTKVSEWMRVGGTNPWGTSPYRTTHYDLAPVGPAPIGGTEPPPFLITEALTDGTSWWVNHYEYDSGSGFPEAEFTPAALGSYTPFDSGNPTTTPSYSASTSAGIIYTTTYDTDNRPSERWIKNGSSGTPIVISRTTWGGSGIPSHLPTKIERFRDEFTSTSSVPDDSVEVTEYDYRFFGDSSAIAAIEIRSEWDGPSFNGPGSGSSVLVRSHDFYDEKGRNVWSRAADDSLTHREFDPRCGGVTLVERNAEPPTSWNTAWDVSGFDSGISFDGRNSSGGSLTSTTTYDLLGRVIESVSSSGVPTYTRHEMRESSDHPGIKYAATVVIPYWISGSGGGATGPVSIVWLDASGGAVASWDCELTEEYALGDSGSDWPQIVTDYEIITSESLLLARSKTERHLSGLTKSQTVWHSTAGDGEGDGTYTTQYFHDALGRISFVINPVGTVTRRSFDVLDRAIEIEEGIADGTEPSAMSTIANYVYDGSGDTPGSGNGNLTRLRQLVDSSSANDRVTEYTYDWRDRLVKTNSPLPPYEARLYDNLDRVVAVALFSSLPSGIPTSFSGTDSTRLSHQRTTYTQRGLVARSETAIVPSSGSQTFLATNHWYDEVGRVVGTQSPNSAARKSTFDGLGRTTVAFVTDHLGDAAQGSGSHDDVYDDFAAKVADDRVLEQTEYAYVPGTATDRMGLLELVTRRQRIHDDSTSDGELDADTSVATYQAVFYDTASRVVATVDYGTTLDEFRAKDSGGNPTEPPSVAQGMTLPTTGPELVTQTQYDTRGLVGASIDPMGRRTRQLYDSLGRTIATVENDANSSVSVSWNDTDELWTVTGVNSGNDVDRVTTFVYNGNGSLLKLVAHNSVTGDQVTEYAYGVSTSSAGVGGTYSVQSAITSNDLLLSAKYPTGSGGSSDAARTVFYGYNRLGEITQLLDQNDTIHSYTRDKSGRVTKDLALTSSTTLDTYMDRVDVAFDSAGRLSKVTGLKDGTTPVTRNEVEFKYTPLWQIEKIYQHSKGAVSYDGFGAPTGDTRLVAYGYSASAATGTGAGGNYSRVSSLAYPRRANSSGVTAEALDYSYAPSGGSGGTAPIDDIISRVHRLRTNVSSSSQADLAVYSYLGLGTPVVVDYAPPDVQLDRTLFVDGKRRAVGYISQAQGYYPGFDRFGRLALQIWADGALDTQWISSGLSGAYYPTKPEIVALEYGYDLNGNRTSAYDLRQGNEWPMNHRYSYDGLNRLTMAERNARSEFIFSAPTEAPEKGSQAWMLDPLGNWLELETWLSDTSSETESRTHNRVNELVSRDIPASSADHTLAYDNTGNLSTDAVSGGSTTTYTHDLWNRLVKVTVGSTVKLEQQFNGLTWRTLKREDTGGSAGLDEERTFAYSAGWQLLEERVDSNYISSPGLNKRVQYFWGLRYIDDCISHRADVNNDGDYVDSNEGTWYHLTDGMFSTVALLNRSGGIAERVTYDSYGQARHHRPFDVDGDGSSGTTDYNIVDGIISGGSVSIGNSSYRAECDLNRDGVINTTDRLFAGVSASALASGLISYSGSGGPDNSIGWDGYVFNPVMGDYLVRHRTYRPTLGRWVERDPIEYTSGLSLYEYVNSIAVLALDPWGLQGAYVHKETVEMAKGLKAYVETCGLGNWGELKILRDGKELTRWRWDRATGVIQEVLEHGGRKLPGVSGAVSRCVEDHIGPILQRMLARADQLKGIAAGGAGARAIRGGGGGGAFKVGALFLALWSAIELFEQPAYAAPLIQDVCEEIELSPELVAAIQEAIADGEARCKAEKGDKCSKCPPGLREHIVRAGDTCWALWRSRVNRAASWDQAKAACAGAQSGDPDKLRVGETICVP